MRLGDLDALKKELQARHDFFINSWKENGVAPTGIPIPDKSRIDEINNCIAMVVNAPTVEARPTGEWNEVEEGCGWTEILCAECSVCKSTFVLGEMTIDDVRDNFKFCSNCGAKMKGEKVRKNE